MSDCQTLLTIASYFQNFTRMSDDVCRMCLQKGTRNNFISLNFGQPSIKSKLQALIPELNLEVIQDPVICGPCSAALENAYQLKVKCLRAEEKIWSHLHSSMALKPMTAPVKLINLLPPSDLSSHEEITVEPNFNYYHSHSDVRTDATGNRMYQSLDSSSKPPPSRLEDTPAVIKGTTESTGDVFVCTTCKESFLSKDELHVHIPKHLGTRPYMCSYCYKCFTLRSNLQIHVRTHTHDRPFSCEYCPKTFTTKGNLKTHTRVHTKEKPYLCQICDKSFIQKVQLNTHMLLHDNDQIFACDVCEKAFSSKSTLIVHKRIHDDVKPFTCEYCDKSFTTNGNLVVHLRKHTGEKPFTCDECSKAFTQAGQLKIHKKSHCNEQLSSTPPTLPPAPTLPPPPTLAPAVLRPPIPEMTDLVVDK